MLELIAGLIAAGIIVTAALVATLAYIALDPKTYAAIVKIGKTIEYWKSL